MLDRVPLDTYVARLPAINPSPVLGHVVRVVGLLVESIGPKARVGEICEVRATSGAPLPLEVVGFRDGRLLSVPLGETAGIQPGQAIISRGSALTIPTGDGLLGRVIDGLGQPIDGKGPLQTTRNAPCTPRRSIRSSASRSACRSVPASAPSTGCSPAAADSASASSAAAASARARCSA